MKTSLKKHELQSSGFHSLHIDNSSGEISPCEDLAVSSLGFSSTQKPGENISSSEFPSDVLSDSFIYLFTCDQFTA